MFGLLPILLCLTAQLSSSFTLDGFELRDLYGDEQFLTEDLAEWSLATVTRDQKTSSCSGPWYVGGSNILRGDGAYSERIYRSLPPHGNIYYSINIAVLGLWEATDYFSLVFDNTEVEIRHFTNGHQTFSSNACNIPSRKGFGGSIIGKIQHSGSQLRFRIVNYLSGSPSLKYFLFRYINFLFKNTPPESESVCIAPSSISVTLLNGWNCPCTMGKIKDANNICQPCNSLCYNCFGNSNNQCYACAANAYYDGTTCQLCDASCATCFGPTNHECYTCNSASFHLHYNHKCYSTCNLPLVSIIKNAKKFCELPVCESGTCQVCQNNNDCPNYYYCQSALTGVYGVCLPYITYSLKADLIRTILNGYMVKVEVVPLVGITDESNDLLELQIEGLEINIDYSLAIQMSTKGVFVVTIKLLQSLQTQSIVIDFTYSPTRLNLKTDLTLEKIIHISPALQKAAGVMKTSSVISFVLLLINTIGFIMTGGLSVLWSFLPENQYSFYLLYLNVNYPYHTEVYFKSLANYNLVFNPGANSTENITTSTKLPQRFIDEEYSSDFSDNATQILLMFVMMSLTLGLVIMLFKCLALPRRSQFGHRILKILYKIIRWNGLFRQLLAYSLPMTLAIFIEFYVSLFEHTSSFLIGLSATAILILIVWGLNKSFWIIRNIPQSSFERIIYSERYGTLYDNLELESPKARYYYWFCTIRGLVLAYMCVFFDVYPYVQIIVLLIYQAFMLSLFFRKFRPRQIFESQSLNLVTFLEELLLMIMKVVILVFVIIEPNLKEDNQIIVTGWLIAAPPIIIQVIQNIYSMYVNIRDRKKIADIIKRISEAVKAMCNKNRKVKKLPKVKKRPNTEEVKQQFETPESSFDIQPI